jgi:hypothetical protein
MPVSRFIFGGVGIKGKKKPNEKREVAGQASSQRQNLRRCLLFPYLSLSFFIKLFPFSAERMG